MSWETVIGLEIHIQLSTQSKIFSGAATTFGALPNTQACAVDLALPGVLPVLNKEAVRMAIMFGLAVDADIAPRSVFARKHYFYPDLPKGYQITQHDYPIVGHGYVDIMLEDKSTKRIHITRAHLEEDAGKSLHEDFHGMSGIDLNRAGTPLLEIVSEPDLRNAKEAVAYLKTIHGLVRYLGICDGNMAEGSLRCDANVSVRRVGDTTFGTRTETKNVNSFRFVERAIDYEVKRQIELLEAGNSVVQETRLYDAIRGETRAMRSKEEAHDYRYFPDPDLLPLQLESGFIEQIEQAMPELPQAKQKRFEADYSLSNYDARLLATSKEWADYFEQTVNACGGEAKLCANWILGELAARLNAEELDIHQSRVSAPKLAELIKRIVDRTISSHAAKTVFSELWDHDGDVDAVIEQKGLKQVTDENAIATIVQEVIHAHPDQVAQYKAGKETLLGFLVGQVMKRSQGKANPEMVNRLLKSVIGEP